MNITLSVIVPIYNVEKYLESCIESILSQTYKEYELILVNDGSVDSSGEICNKYAMENKHVKLIHKENGGVSSARNIGIDNANGKYISFIDPDDTIETNMFEIMMDAMKKLDPDIVVCPIKMINRIINQTTTTYVWHKTNSLIEKRIIETEILPEVLNANYYSLLQCPNKIYHRRIIEHHKIRFDEKRDHGEDARFNLTLLTYINSIVFIEEPLYNYYIRKGSSLSQSFNKKQYRNLLDNKNFGISLCEKYNQKQAIDKIINHFVLGSLSHMQSVAISDLTKREKNLIISKIMYDTDFIRHIVNGKCPTTYSKLLKRISIYKKVNIFILIVNSKILFQSLVKKINKINISY